MTVLQLVSVNYFTSDAITHFVESLTSQQSSAWQLSIVDNSQSEDEAARLRELAAGDPRITVAVAPSNLGYFGAAQWWLENQSLTADWLAVCNADVTLPDLDFVERLAAIEPALVVAPSITASPSHHQQNPFMTVRPTLRRMLLRRVALSSRVSAWLAKNIAAWKKAFRSARPNLPSQDIYAPHGSFILFSRRFFDEGGSLHHPLFLFGEELTVAETVWRLGSAVRYEPGLRVVHNEHQATGRVSARVYKAQREAALYSYKLIESARALRILGRA